MKKVISNILATTCLLACLVPTAEAAQFNDVHVGDWYYNAVAYVEYSDIMGGVGDHNFAPNDPTTRGMFVTILHNLEGKPEPSGEGFADVNDSDWFAKAATWAKEMNIVSGSGDNMFNPNDALTREQLVAMLYTYQKETGGDVYHGAADLTFTDSDKVSEWAKVGIAWAHKYKVVRGRDDGSFDPTGKASRAEVAVILQQITD